MELGKLLFEMNQMKVTPLKIDPFCGADLVGMGNRPIQRRGSSLSFNLTLIFQNSTGYSYSSFRTFSHLELSENMGFGILEDDWARTCLRSPNSKTPLGNHWWRENVLYIIFH